MNRYIPDISGAPVGQRWDLFCRVVDNLGDVAVMWRLARQLSLEHRCLVRLFIDQPAVLRRLVPCAKAGQSVDGVGIRAMPDDKPPGDASLRDTDVVLTGFHAQLPSSCRKRMMPHRPVWINLEYLSAEGWIDDFHGLPSPRPDGLTEHYFYPGFTARSGGLLREADLIGRRDAFMADEGQARRFLAGLGVHRRGDESLASLLCYPSAPIDALARQLAGSAARLHLLVPRGAVRDAVDPEALASLSRGHMRLTPVPFLPQYDYDQLLWACDLNFVRGEDSWIRAVWSGKPFVWQVYKQADAVHLRKLKAFLALLDRSGTDAAARLLAGATRWWNGVPGAPPSAIAALAAQPAQSLTGLDKLASLVAEPDLATRLIAFAAVIRHQNLAAVPPASQL